MKAISKGWKRTFSQIEFHRSNFQSNRYTHSHIHIIQGISIKVRILTLCAFHRYTLCAYVGCHEGSYIRIRRVRDTRWSIRTCGVDNDRVFLSARKQSNASDMTEKTERGVSPFFILFFINIYFIISVLI